MFEKRGMGNRAKGLKTTERGEVLTFWPYDEEEDESRCARDFLQTSFHFKPKSSTSCALILYNSRALLKLLIE